MPTFVVVRNVYIVLMICLGVSHYFFGSIPIVYYILSTLFFISLIVLGSANIKLNFFIKAKNSLETKEQTIALTFDDGPSVAYTSKVLELLDQYNAKGTFFCIGEKIKKSPELTRAIHEKGHTLGNHSFSHRNSFPLFSAKRIVQEIEKTNQLIYRITGVSCQLFRPPFGVTNPTIAKAIRSLGMQTIGWNIRSFDTSTKDPGRVIKRVISKIKPGTIILLHDDRPHIPKILEAILLYAQQNNYTCVGLPNLKN